MPYSYPKNIPSAVKNIPAGAQKLYIKAFNAVLRDGGDEKQARQAGWNNVKTKYKKVGKKWVEKKKTKAESTQITLEITGVDQFVRENVTEHYISLKGSIGHVSLSFKEAPPEFLTEVGATVIIILSDGKDAELGGKTISQFGDPTNHLYLIDSKESAEEAINSFGMAKNQKKYSVSERAQVWGRIKCLAKKYVKMDEIPPWNRKKAKK